MLLNFGSQLMSASSTQPVSRLPSYSCATSIRSVCWLPSLLMTR